MKKRWESPNLTQLGVENTQQLRSPNPDYGHKVYCPYCQTTFANAAVYQAHKVDDFTSGGNLLGQECPNAPKGDNSLQAQMDVVDS